MTKGKQKEPYFSSATIQIKALEMYQELEPYRRRRTTKLTLDQSALLILDMQAYFLEASSHAYVPSASAILPGINTLAQAYSQRGLPVIFTRHVNSPQDAGVMARWWRDLITPENPLSAIIPELDLSMGEVVEKSQYDAFYKTSLEQMLRREGVSQVVICGVMTHLCAETTARSAFVRGLDVFFPVDGTATYNESFHRATLFNLAHGFATIVLIKDILSVLGGFRAG